VSFQRAAFAANPGRGESRLEYHRQVDREGTAPSTTVLETPRSRVAEVAPLLSVLAVSFMIRVRDLAYNGPFIDEAFHSVASEYGNVPFLTGEVFLYPHLSHFLHAHWGLTGTRFVSVVFGTVTVGCVYKLAEIIARRFTDAAGVRVVAFASALVFGVSSSALFVSQFANYYAMSFLLFALGMWLTARGIERGGPLWLSLGAAALVGSYATRYVMLGYLPFAMLYVVYHANAAGAQRVGAKWFWISFVVLLVGYSGWNHEHIRAAVLHAHSSGIGMVSDPSLKVRLLVLWEAFGRLAPTAVLAAVGLFAAGRRALRDGSSHARRQRFDLAWLAAGALAMVLYHVVSCHDLTMESNLTVAAMFGAILAGLGIQHVASFFVTARQRVLGTVVAVAACVAALLHTYTIVGEDQIWPDWTPVVEAARARCTNPEHAIWSTADNGGMFNTWGIRQALSPMSGNVWHLRRDLGERVNVASPWYDLQGLHPLTRAAREEVAYVIGPMPQGGLRIGAHLNGYVVTDVVVVPHGPEVYIFRNARIRR
jgi:hypothetical protein